MASFEQIVDSLSLNIIVPKVVLEFPPQDIDDSAWLRKLRSEEIERERAFFGILLSLSPPFFILHWFPFLDEWLDFFFVLSLEQLDEASADPAHPPFDLLSFLAHTQVSYDATYISPTSASALSAPRLGTPPRTTSLKLSAGSGALPNPPNLFPLNTPNPTPMATEQDRRYVRAEGVALVSGIWGEELDPTKLTHVKDRDGFALLWDETAGVWVAVYRMCVNVGALWQTFDCLSCSCRASGSVPASTCSQPTALSHSIDHGEGEASSHNSGQGIPGSYVHEGRGPLRIPAISAYGVPQQHARI